MNKEIVELLVSLAAAAAADDDVDDGEKVNVKLTFYITLKSKKVLIEQKETKCKRTLSL
jgi:hypothetical protein